MQTQKPQKFNLIGLIIIALFIAFSINPILGIIGIVVIIFFLKKNPKYLTSYFSNYLQAASKLRGSLTENNQPILEKTALIKSAMPLQIPSILFNKTKIRLEKRKKYLHVALNSTLEEAREIISQLPTSDRILIEAGTPLIKIYGTEAVSQIKEMAPAGAYIVADNKCADLAAREVEMMAGAGANAATCLGVAPVETIDSFFHSCLIQVGI